MKFDRKRDSNDLQGHKGFDRIIRKSISFSSFDRKEWMKKRVTLSLTTTFLFFLDSFPLLFFEFFFYLNEESKEKSPFIHVKHSFFFSFFHSRKRFYSFFDHETRIWVKDHNEKDGLSHVFKNQWRTRLGRRKILLLALNSLQDLSESKAKKSNWDPLS
jgi:hypothetical protein